MKTNHAIEQTVASYISHHHMASAGQSILVALSGGPDSVCLALILQQLQFPLVAIHCNFHLRDAESNRDENFVREFCQQHGIELHVRHFDTIAYANEHQISIEMAARELRYRAFRELSADLHIKRTAIAHHQDDNVETFLMNLIRGTGINGLCGIPPVGPGIMRPLLCLSRQQIMDYLQAAHTDFVTDSTNNTLLYQRNRVRHQLVPLLHELNPTASEGILRTIENMCEVNKTYSPILEQCASACLDSPETIHIPTLLRAPSPISVLHQLLTPLHYNRTQLGDILEAIPHIGSTFQSSTHILIIDREHIIIRNRENDNENENDNCASRLSCEDNENDDNHLLLSSSFSYQIVPAPRPGEPPFIFPESPNIACFDADLLSHPISIRTLRTGDRFTPLGMKGSKLVSDFLTDLKLNRFEKQEQPLLFCGDTIAWVVGHRISNLFRVRPDTQHICIVTYHATQPMDE